MNGGGIRDDRPPYLPDEAGEGDHAVVEGAVTPHGVSGGEDQAAHLAWVRVAAARLAILAGALG